MLQAYFFVQYKNTYAYLLRNITIIPIIHKNSAKLNEKTKKKIHSQTILVRASLYINDSY